MILKNLLMSWTISAASSMFSHLTWTLIADPSLETKRNKGTPSPVAYDGADSSPSLALSSSTLRLINIFAQCFMMKDDPKIL
jgi:hypothetical protein